MGRPSAYVKAQLLAANPPLTWDISLGRLSVRQVRVEPSGSLWVYLDSDDFPTDPDGYYFVNPPLIHEGIQNPAAAFRQIVTDAAIYYATHPEVWGRTTTTVFSSVADGRLHCSSTVYATASAGLGTFSVNTTAAGGGENSIGQEFVTPTYYCNQTFLNFDTSSIPDADTIDSAVLSIYGQYDQSDTDFTVEARLKNWGGTLTSADWTPGLDLGTLSLLATFATAGWSTSAYNVLTSDAAFVSNILKTGTTYIMLSSSRQRVGSLPTGNERVGIYLAEQAGTTQDPKLVINHSAGAQIIAVAKATETDTAQVLTRSKSVTTGQVAEANVAQAIGRVKKFLIGQAFEVDAAQSLAVSKVVAVGRATEVDSAGSVSWQLRRLIGQAFEVDSATVVSARKTVELGVASEVDSAQVVSWAIVRLIGQATEADSAQTVSAAKRLTVGQTVESDIAQMISGVKSLLVGRASEVDSAGAVVASKALAVGRATESNQAQTVSPQRAYAVGQAQESDAAQAVSAAKNLLAGQVVEADIASLLTVRKVRSVGQAVEADSAGVITPIRCTQPDSTVTVGIWITNSAGIDLHTAIDETPASDADFIRGPIDLLAATHTCEVGLGNVTDPAVSTGHGVSYRYEKSAANEQVVDLIVRLVQGTTVIATWTHLAIANGWTTASQTLTGLEADAITDYTDLRLRFSQVTAVGLIARRARVSWAQFCVPIESGVVVQVGRATETDTALSITSRKVLVVGPALEADTALELVTALVIPILKALETDTARSIVYQPIIGRAVETDLARGLVRNLAFDILQCEAKWKAEESGAKWVVTPSK